MDNLIHEISSQMASWSRFASEMRKHHQNTLFPTATIKLQNDIRATKQRLDALEITIQEFLNDGQSAKLHQSIRGSQLFIEVLEFSECEFAVFLMLHASHTLIIQRMLQLLGMDSGDSTNSRYVLRICQSYEFAWKRRPVGAQYMHIPLQTAYPNTQNTALREWILQALNDLDEHRSLPAPRYNDFSVCYLFKLYTGVIEPPETLWKT
jgi:hypothetical protein